MKQKTSMTISEEGMRLLAAMAKADGISRTAMMEIAIREAARKRGTRVDSGVQGLSQPGPTAED